MDDVLAKPIQPAQLISKLVQWGSGESTQAEAPIAATA